ncbi:MAG: DUF1501 domain-containing protein [Bacteroidota bacterium]
MKRRQFLRNAGSSVAVPLVLKGMSLTAMSKSLFNFINNDNDRVLVIIQMNGGNDGLNMVIPVDKYSALQNNRANILIPENKVLSIFDGTGLHPSMTGLEDMHQDSFLSVVQAVGYPNQNRSHFRSKDIWSTASDAEVFLDTGWLGRYFQDEHSEFPIGYPNEDHPDPFAITLGNNTSETCQGTVSNFSMTLKDPFSLSTLYEGAPGELANTYYSEELEFLRTSIIQTNKYSTRIGAAAEAGSNTIEYPDTKLGDQLKTIALLISGGLKTKIYVANIGGWDTHSAQVNTNNTTNGRHADLLAELSNAIHAFQSDLVAQSVDERVIGMTFSEFGRRIKSNGSAGTDHGTAAPLFLFGSCINPVMHGENPDIPMEAEPKEGVAMQIDFRDIYGSILMDWFNVDEGLVQNLIHPDFQYYPITKDCAQTTTSNEEVIVTDSINLFPNPASSWTTLSFELQNETWTKLSVFNNEGKEMKVVLNKVLLSGPHQIKIDLSHFAAGNYYYRLQTERAVKTKHFIKL